MSHASFFLGPLRFCHDRACASLTLVFLTLLFQSGPIIAIQPIFFSLPPLWPICDSMQSFFQYRRFAKHVARQYERDKLKAEALANPDTSESTSPFSSNAANSPPVADAHDHVDTRDPEKGEQSNGQLADPHHRAETPDLVKDEEEGGGYAPIQAARTGRPTSQGGEAPEDMSRAATVPTRESMGTALGTTLTGIDIRDRSTKEGGDGKVFVVGYEGDNDMMNPHNWTFFTRLAAT